MMKEEKILKEGLENLSENQDNVVCKSAFAFWIIIGCTPFLAKVIIERFLWPIIG